MLSSVLACLVGVLGILVIAESLWRRKLLKGEYQRKFVHISVTSFVAFWPWLIGMRAIRFIGLAMLAVLLINHLLKTLHYSAELRQRSYGGASLALAFSASATLTNSKLLFALAILHVALADGLAAVVGYRYGKKWRYYIFGQLKTVVGTLTFWFVSFCILAPGLLFSDPLLPYNHYALLLLLLPPALAAIENLAVIGFDNIAVPLAVILVLQSL